VLDFKLSCRSVALAKFIVSQVYRITVSSHITCLIIQCYFASLYSFFTTVINSSFWRTMCLQWFQGNWRWVLGLVAIAAAVDLRVCTVQFSFEKRYFTGTYFYQNAVMLLIHIVKHIASVISALSLVQHTETNIAKRLLGCAILTVYLCFIMLNMFDS
jgi:hypothetical protein